jgi:hypothetical protein
MGEMMGEIIRYRAGTDTGAVICPFVKRGIICSRFATCHTAAAITVDALFTSSGTMRP